VRQETRRQGDGDGDRETGDRQERRLDRLDLDTRQATQLDSRQVDR
jgi:hypothetical protein